MKGWMIWCQGEMWEEVTQVIYQKKAGPCVCMCACVCDGKVNILLKDRCTQEARGKKGHTANSVMVTGQASHRSEMKLVNNAVNAMMILDRGQGTNCTDTQKLLYLGFKLGLQAHTWSSLYSKSIISKAAGPTYTICIHLYPTTWKVAIWNDEFPAKNKAKELKTPLLRWIFSLHTQGPHKIVPKRYVWKSYIRAISVH